MRVASPYIRVGRSLGEGRALDVAKRSVNCSARDFLEAWGRGKAGPVPCAGCSACCYYAGVPVDKKRDRSRLPHLLTERNHDGELVLQRRARWQGLGSFGVSARARASRRARDRALISRTLPSTVVVVGLLVVVRLEWFRLVIGIQ